MRWIFPRDYRASLHAEELTLWSCAKKNHYRCIVEPVIQDTHQNDLCLVEFLLYSHDGIRLPWILILSEVRLNIRERNRGGVGIRRLGNFGRKLIQDLGQERESRPHGVFLVGDNDGYGTRMRWRDKRQKVAEPASCSAPPRLYT